MEKKEEVNEKRELLKFVYSWQLPNTIKGKQYKKQTLQMSSTAY